MIEINEYFKKALKIIEEGKNIFITGRAGTGKSTLLQYFRENSTKNVVVLAPTGVAALNVKGQTIHSFFRFKPDVTIDKVKKMKIKRKDIYKNIDVLVIDEISMVRADLLDCMDIFMRNNGRKTREPFGGVQVVFFGDLYQLPPVVKTKEKEIFKDYYKTPYFFSARCFEDLKLEFVELEKIYRQKDEKFIQLLNKIRNRTITDEEIEILNQRYDKYFEPSEKDMFIQLVTRNEIAERINNNMLSKLKGKIFYYRGEIEGEFERDSIPCPEELKIKKGAQVMLVNNDSMGRWVNGSVGKIIGIEEDETDIIVVKLTDGRIVEVTPVKWELFRYYYNKEELKIETEKIGTYIQYPIILAWAITIHKSQGKTFDKVIIDLSGGAFAAGQLYVALSRCTTLDGIILKSRISRKDILIDWEVVKFITRYQYKKSEEKMGKEEKIKIIEKAKEEGRKLEIVYLKTCDEKSKRIVKPYEVGEMEYKGNKFLGFKGYDEKSKELRTFRIERILSIKEI